MTRMRGAVLGAVILLTLLLLCACVGRVPDGATETHLLRVARGGETPTAADFLTEDARARCQRQGIEIAFASEPDFATLGEQTVTLTVGVATVEATCRVIDDVTPPSFSGVRDRSVRIGEGAVLREGVVATDDCFGAVSWTVDASALDTGREGYYAVYYRATDAVGNAAERMAYVTVYAEDVTEEQLYAACDAYLADLIPAGASREDICRLIWTGVQSRISYFPLSDKTSPIRAAYLALFREGRGDCYSYFTAACALLSRAGVDYLTIERTHAEGEETHYWLMVDLAEQGEAPRWYHFDPTELDTGGYPHDGCLFTDAELDAYNAHNVGFYDYDRTAYPPSATQSLR